MNKLDRQFVSRPGLLKSFWQDAWNSWSNARRFIAAQGPFRQPAFELNAQHLSLAVSQKDEYLTLLVRDAHNWIGAKTPSLCLEQLCELIELALAADMQRGFPLTMSKDLLSVVLDWTCDGSACLLEAMDTTLDHETICSARGALEGLKCQHPTSEDQQFLSSLVERLKHKTLVLKTQERIASAATSPGLPQQAHVQAKGQVKKKHLWECPGLPDSLRELALALEGRPKGLASPELKEQITAISNKPNVQDPSKTILNNRTKWGHWIDRWIDQPRRGVYRLRTAKERASRRKKSARKTSAKKQK